MITAIVHWRADEGISREELLTRFRKSIPVYKGREHLLRKYICFDMEAHRGLGVYLWDDRAAADAFYEIARPMIKEETGYDPVVEFFDTPIIVDNVTGATEIFD